MIRKFFLWIQRRPRLVIVSSLSLAFVLLNAVAYKQAYAMLNFTRQGRRTEEPETLSLLKKVRTLLMGVNIPRPLNHETPADWGLPFAVHRFKVNNTIELEAWHIPHPQTKGLAILFHGYASAKASLLPEARALRQLGYACFLVDFRGSGGSNGHQTSIGFDEADDVVTAIEYARSMSAQSPLILYGRSMGGAAILRAIHVHQIQPDAIIVEAIFDRLLSTVQNRFAAMGIPAFPAAHLLIFWGGIQNGHFGFRHDPIEYAASVQCPALLLHGTDDPRATLREGLAVFQRLGGKKQFEAFTSVGHEAYLTARPEQWQLTITQFLARLHDHTI